MIKMTENQTLFIFFTGEIDDEEKKYLSYEAKKIEKKEKEDFDLYKKRNFIFVYLREEDLQKKDASYINVVDKILKDIDISVEKINKIYVFYHGTDIEGHPTEFSYQQDKSNALSEEFGKNIKAYYFTHTSNDPVNSLLVNYKETFEKYHIKYENNIEKAVINLFDKFVPITGDDIENIVEKTDNYHLFDITEVNFLERQNFNIFINYLKDDDRSGAVLPAIFAIPGELKDKINQKRINFLDSSIWFRTVEYKDKVDKDAKLEKIKKEIESYKGFGIYNSAIAREYRDLQLKMALIEPLKGGAHAGKIAPFQFHSETEMQKKTTEIFEIIKEYKWDFLLIDDFAEKGLRKFKKNKEFGGKTKIEILENIIGKEIIIKLDYALYIEKNDENSAINKIKKNKYDIILLDYLFSNEEIFEKNKPEYGIKFFNLIRKGEIKKNKAIKEKYWIFPVSVFNSALLSNMQKKGYEYYTENWYFSPGADPINTPNLFKYKLYKFLELQTKYFPFNSEDLISVLLEYELGEKSDANSLKEYAFKTLPYFLEKYGFIFELEHTDKPSAFINSIKKFINDNTEHYLSFTSYNLAEEIRSFLNFAYNPAFQRNLLLDSFLKLTKYKDVIVEKCEIKEEKKEALNEFFDELIKYVIEF